MKNYKIDKFNVVVIVGLTHSLIDSINQFWRLRTETR